MSRASRRKTLSHSEIENFLSEIDVPSDVVYKKSLPSFGAQFCVPLSPVSSNPIVSTKLSEVQLIREFTKATFSSYREGVPVEPSQALCDIGRDLLEESTYPILSRRLLRPNDYLYPSSSLEGKKALLVSLTPMLAEAEEQRKKETSACENFTRCKAGKGKSKFSGYDYVDIDVKSSVDFAEYEKRYLLYIGHNKKTYSKDTPLSPSLNYITFHHRQRTHRTQSSTGFPRRNLNNTLCAQKDGDENAPCDNNNNNMPPPAIKTRTKRQITVQSVALDHSTMELVGALLQKPKKIGNETNRPVLSTAPCTSMQVESEVTHPPAEEKMGEVVEAVDSATYTNPSPSSAMFDSNFNTRPEPVTDSLIPAEFDDVMDYEDSVIESSGGSTCSNSAGVNERKRKHGRSNRSRQIDRRGTLSPASVRAMLLEACDATLAEAPLLPTESVTDVDDAEGEQEDCDFQSQETTAATVESTVLFRHNSPGKTAINITITPTSSASKNRASKGNSPSPEEHLYRLECARSGDELDSFEQQSEQTLSPQCKQGKKYARSGSPSDICGDRADSVESVVEPCNLYSRSVLLADSMVDHYADASAEVADVCMDEESDHVHTTKQVEVAEEKEEEGKVYREEDDVCGQFSVELKTVVAKRMSMSLPDPADLVTDSCDLEQIITESCDVACEYEANDVEEEVVEAPTMQIVETAAFSVMTYESRQSTPTKTTPSISTDSIKNYSPSTASTPLLLECVDQSVRAEELSAEDKATIDDFGRELDSILCDVSTLGPSSPFTRSSSTSGRSPVDVDDADVSCFSPYVPSARSHSPVPTSSTSSTHSVDCIEFVEQGEDGGAYASPAAEEEEELYDQLEVIDSKADASSSAAAPTTASLPRSECTVASTDFNDAVPICDETTISAHVPSSCSSEEISSVVYCHASCGDVTPTEKGMLASIIEIERILIPSPSSPIQVNNDHFSDDESERDEYCVHESIQGSDVGVMSMDDSVLIFTGQDDELDDFEKLESMVEQEYINGNLALEAKFAGSPAQLMHDQPGCDALDPLTPAIRKSVLSPLRLSSPSLSLPCPINALSGGKQLDGGKSPAGTSAERRRQGTSCIPRYSPGGGAVSSSTRVVLAPPLPSPSSTVSIPPMQDNTTSADVLLEERDLPVDIDINAALSRAKVRYEEKLLVARWQFEWDIVSVQAANAAIMKWKGRST